jgi:hypothetical protein
VSKFVVVGSGSVGGTAVAAVPALGRTLAAVIVAAAAGVSGVGVATGHFESEPVIVVVLAVEILDAVVAGSLGVEVDGDVGFALAAVAALGRAVVAVIAAVAGVAGVDVVPEHAGLVSVVVVGSAVEVFVDEVVVAGSFVLGVDDAGFALAAVAEGAEPAAPAVAAHSEWVG